MDLEKTPYGVGMEYIAALVCSRKFKKGQGGLGHNCS